MRKVLRIGKDVKSKRERVNELLREGMEGQDFDAKVQLIQELIPLGLMQVQKMLEEEVKELAGERYKRNGRVGHVRWTRQWGSIYLGDQKVPIEYQRVRDIREGKEAELASYRGFQKPREHDEGVMRKLLHGLSCRRYEECCALVPEVFGMSSSTLSRRFKQVSERKLKELVERRLDDLDIVVLIIDGKSFAEDEMIVVMGVTIEGDKQILGFVQAGTENARVTSELIGNLLSRGLRYEEGLFCVVDGSKGFAKAIRKKLKGYALIQRCQWHKRENVVSYLPKKEQSRMRKALQDAYRKKSYAAAKTELLKLREELSLMNQSAVRSLDEGLEETLTLHRLGLFTKLGRSLKTTNCIESLMSLIGQKVDKVDCWKNSNQKQRWLATVLLDVEPRLNKICGYRHLPQLRKAIQRELKIDINKRKEVEAA